MIYFGISEKCSIFAPPKTIWCDEFVAQQVEHNTFNVGVLGSSPSEFTRRLQKCGRLFLFVVQLRCFSKENIRNCMQASIRYSLYRDMHSISTTNKNGQLDEALLWGYLGRVFPHRASATFGTPSVTAKAVRAPRRWCNCVVSVKRIFVIVCKHPHDIPFYCDVLYIELSLFEKLKN